MVFMEARDEQMQSESERSHHSVAGMNDDELVLGTERNQTVSYSP